jgi:hypothetical protein
MHYDQNLCAWQYAVTGNASSDISNASPSGLYDAYARQAAR